MLRIKYYFVIFTHFVSFYSCCNNETATLPQLLLKIHLKYHTKCVIISLTKGAVRLNIFGERLKNLRQAKKITQQELADELGIAASTVGMYEQGRREPDRTTLLAMSSFFGVSVDYLLTSDSSQDVCALIDGLRNQAKSADSLMFNGVPIDSEDSEKIFDAMLIAANVIFNNRQKEKEHDQ